MEQTIPTKFYRVGTSYLGGFGGGTQPPSGAIEVPNPPQDVAASWDVNTSSWVEPVKTDDEKIGEVFIEQEISLEDRIQALEKKIMENDSTEADEIQAIKEGAK